LAILRELLSALARAAYVAIYTVKTVHRLKLILLSLNDTIIIIGIVIIILLKYRMKLF